MKPETPRILVLCTANRCRSQMAEGWLRHLARDRLDVHSAGTEPRGLHPLAVRVMSEAGVDISNQHSKVLSECLQQRFDVVVTVCDRAQRSCPTFSHVSQTIHEPFEDPDVAGLSEAELLPLFRRTRDQIRDWARGFVEQIAHERVADKA